MLATKIISFAIISVILIITLRRQLPEYAIILSIISCIFIFFMVLPQFNNIFIALESLTQNFNIHSNYILALIKIIGIAYICEFASQICIDAGEGAIAKKIELSGKILIISCSIPILNDLMELVLNLI